MIDNAAHDILIRAAGEVGWDEMSMLLLATRFIARLNCEDPTVLEKLEAYLEEQVAEESAEHAAVQVPDRAAAPAAKTASVQSSRSKPQATTACPRPCRRL